MFDWTKNHVFETATLAAVAAVATSFVVSYRDLARTPASAVNSSRLPVARQVDDAGQQIPHTRGAENVDRRSAVYRSLGGHGLMIAVVGLLYVARRVEHRRREVTFATLLDADERFALLARESAHGIALADGGGRIQIANPALEAMFAVGAGALRGQHVNSLFESTVVDDWITRRIDEDFDPAFSRTVSAKRCDGEKFKVDLTVMPQKIRKQEFLSIAVKDVTEREESRLRLKQHEALLEEIPEPLHILDGGGRIVYWNVGAERLFGFSAAEAIGKTANDLLQIVPPEGDSENVHAVQYVDAPRWTGELRAVGKDGRVLRIERRRTSVSEGETAVGDVIFDLDLGQRSHQKTVERRRQRLESLGTLASGITHDLNNLLTPILMSARMLQREDQNLDRDAMLETIVSAANRGAELIAQLLTFARGGDGQHEPVDVGELLNDVSRILAHTLTERTVYSIDVETSLSRIMADATEISQVIMNLAINARDAMPEGGNLTISARRLTLVSERTYSLVTLQPGEYVAVSVSDEGIGIPQNIRDRIFDPFFSTKERGQGTGLGLSTSLGIIRGHGGAIEVSSDVGQGTRMTVILPAMHEQESENV